MITPLGTEVDNETPQRVFLAQDVPGLLVDVRDKFNDGVKPLSRVHLTTYVVQRSIEALEATPLQLVDAVVVGENVHLGVGLADVCPTKAVCDFVVTGVSEAAESEESFTVRIWPGDGLLPRLLHSVVDESV